MNKNTKLNEEAKRKKALNLVKKLIDKYGAGGYVFRGVNEEYSRQKNNGVRDGINSTLYRKIMEEKEGKALKKALAKNVIDFFPAYMEEKIVNEARRYFPPSANDLEILTVLQHFGGATNMIDFSRSIYVALFFACQGNADVPGEFIALSLKKAEEIHVIDYKDPPKKRKLEIIAPAYSQDSSYRVNFQASIFVRSTEGYISPGKCEIKKVPADLKKYLLQCIKNAGGITLNNVYNDFHGVITTQRDFLKRNTFSYLARAHYFNGNIKESLSCSKRSFSLTPYESYTDYNDRGIIYTADRKHSVAIEDFNKAISLKPDFAEAYSNRGAAYNQSKQYERAIKDFDKAISLNPSLAECYYNRGVSYGFLLQYKRAIKDFNKAISLRPDFYRAYFNRAIAYNEHENYELAIEDFDKAIKSKPDYAKAYYCRGLTKKDMGNKKGARADLAKAKKLGYTPPKPKK